MRLICKYLINNIKHDKDEITLKTKEIIEKMISDKSIYKQNEHLITRLIEYLQDHKKFTITQQKAIERFA